MKSAAEEVEDYYFVIIISDSGPLVPRLKTYLLKILGFNQANNFLLKTRSCCTSNAGGGEESPRDKKLLKTNSRGERSCLSDDLTDLCIASRRLH